MGKLHARLRAVLLVSSALAGVTAALPALAQDRGSSALDEIIVTAQKREQSLQDVPISIQVVSGAQLADRGIRNFQDASTLVPNFTVVKTPGADGIFMRGVGSGAGSPTLEQSVVMFIDGIYAGNSRQFMTPFLDIERLEILRGPQGALVGKNTSAGAINILTRKPGKEFGGYVMGAYDFELKGPQIEGAVDIPLSDKFRVRLVGKYTDMDGWIRNTLNGRDEPTREEKVGRIVAVYQDGPWDITGKFERSEVRINGNPFQVTSNRAGRYLDYNKETGRSFFGPEFDNVDSTNFALNISYALGDFTIQSVTGYSGYQSDQREDADFFERDLAYAFFIEDLRSTSQEFRLLSPTGRRFEYILGAYYSDSRLREQRATGIVFAQGTSTYRPFNQDGTATSVYGQGTWNISDDLRLQGSLRYTQEKKTGTFKLFTGNQAVQQRIGVLSTQIAQSFTNDNVDPSLSVQWDATDRVMLYATYSRGSKSGGFQGAIANALPATFLFRPETSQSYEVGAKTSFTGGYLNIAVFNTTYSDLQLSASIPSTSPTTFAFFTGNAGESRSRGVEADAAYRFTDRFRVTANAAYIDAVYTNYTDGPCYAGQAPTNPVKGSCSYTGKRLGFTPKWSANLTATYAQPINDALKMELQASTVSRSSAIMNYLPDPTHVQKAYTKLDVRVALMDTDERWEVAVIGRNLTDEKTTGFVNSAGLAANLALGGIGTDANQLTIDPPRTFSVQAKYNF